jgi:hypothetical protein
VEVDPMQPAAHVERPLGRPLNATYETFVAHRAAAFASLADRARVVRIRVDPLARNERRGTVPSHDTFPSVAWRHCQKA